MADSRDLLAGHGHVRAAANRVPGSRDGARDESGPVHQHRPPEDPPNPGAGYRDHGLWLRCGWAMPTPQAGPTGNKGEPWITDRNGSYRAESSPGASSFWGARPPQPWRLSWPPAGATTAEQDRARPPAAPTRRPEVARRQPPAAPTRQPPRPARRSPAARCGSASSVAPTTSSTASSSWPRPIRPAWSPAGSHSSATTPTSTWCTRTRWPRRSRPPRPTSTSSG